jgi:hypothetical protein
MDAQEFAALGSLPAQAQALIDKLKSVTKWKGNHPPNTEHFPPESISVDGGVLVDEKRLWVAFDFKDPDGTDHNIKATMQWDEPGTSGGNDVLTYDGEDVEADDFVLNARAGMEGFLNFYARPVFNFRGAIAEGQPFYIRFDGLGK